MLTVENPDTGDVIQVKDVLTCGDSVDYKFEKECRSREATEGDYRKWFVKDAKEGDVLVSESGQPFIFSGLVNKTSVGAYCGINVLGIFTRPKFKDNWTDLRVKPATQEQHDRLFSEMGKAGYEWDAKKMMLQSSATRKNTNILP